MKHGKVLHELGSNTRHGVGSRVACSTDPNYDGIDESSVAPRHDKKALVEDKNGEYAPKEELNHCTEAHVRNGSIVACVPDSDGALIT